MRTNIEDNSSFNHHFKSGKFSHARVILTSDVRITVNGSIVNHLDPNGADRKVELPPLEEGRFYVIANVGTANVLNVVSANGLPVTSVEVDACVVLFSSEAEWVGVQSWVDLNDFGIAGPDHKHGLVPDPGATFDPDPSHRRYLSELGWVEISEISGDDFFKYIKGGAVTLSPTGADTVEFASVNNLLTILAVAGSPDKVNFTVNNGNIDHDGLLNFVANEHIDHTAVVLTAGTGLSGGGDISSSRTFALDLSDLTTDTPELADTFAFYDVSGADTNKATFTTLNGILDHNALLNYSANRHVDHSGVSIVAGSGLSGGGTIETSRTLTLDINSLVADTISSGDFLAFWDISGSDNNKVTFANLNAALDHNALLNYVANQHVDHTAVQIVSGAGLIGGGDLTATRTIDVGAGTGISVSAGAVGLDTASVHNVDHSAVSISTTEGVQGGGTIAATRTLKLDINGLTEDTAPDPNDFLVTYDVSAATHKKVKPRTFFREVLTANRTYYVRSDGSDSNTGLVDTAGGAFLTGQKAMDVIKSTLDVAGYTVTVQYNDATRTVGVQIGNWVGGGVIVFQGNSGTPANVYFTVTGDAFDASFGLLPGIVRIKDMKIKASGIAIVSRSAGRLQYTNVILEGPSFAFIAATGGALIEPYGTYSTLGNFTNHWLCDAGGTINSTANDLPSALTTITIGSSPTFTDWALCNNRSLIYIRNTVVYSGGVTAGRKASVNQNSVVNSGGVTMPGPTAAATATGGQFI